MLRVCIEKLIFNFANDLCTYFYYTLPEMCFLLLVTSLHFSSQFCNILEVFCNSCKLWKQIVSLLCKMPCLSVYSTSWSLWSLCSQCKCICWNSKPPNWKLILNELDKSCIKEALSFKHMKWNCNPRSSSRHSSSRYLKFRLY